VQYAWAEQLGFCPQTAIAVEVCGLRLSQDVTPLTLLATHTETISSAVARIGRPHRLCPKPTSDFRSRKENDIPEWLLSHTRYGDVAVLNATINTNIRYDNSLYANDGCRQNFAYKIAAKPLQIETWLLLTGYRNSSSSYSTVLSPTPYDVSFSHNTYVTDDRQTAYYTQSSI